MRSLSFLGAALLFGALAGPASAQRFVVEPATTVLAGEPLAIRLEGLPPLAEVQVQAQRQVRDFTGRLRPFAATARFVADAAGRIDFARQAPLPGGSYAPADVRGLFWSMVPKPDIASAGAAMPVDPADAPPPEGSVLLRATRVAAGASTSASAEVLARQSLHFQLAHPALTTRPAAGFPGALFSTLPVAAGTTPGARRPALILLGGSEGGSLVTRTAALWSSRGFAVLALPYYSPPGWGPAGPTPPELPTLPPAFADIPLERLEAARDWLVGRSEVDPARIGVLGTSKGAEFALAAAVRMPWIRSVVAVVPSDVIWEGWGPGVNDGERSSFAWRGQPLPFVPYKDFALEWQNIARGEPVLIRRPQDKGRAANPERVAPARIAVEAISAPVMVIGAHDDQVWDSGGMAEAIAASRHKAGRETLALIYREGGHALGGTGWAPTTQFNAGPMKMGGSAEATARAQADAFAQTVAFLRRTLGPVAGQ